MIRPWKARFGWVVAFALIAWGVMSKESCARAATTDPQGTLTEGQSLTLVAVVEGGIAPFSFQWYKNGERMESGVSAELSFPSLQLSDTGLYSVVVSNAAGEVASMPEMLAVAPRPRSRLVNLSVDASGRETVVGFALGGGASSAATRMLARAAGPSLAPFNVIGVLPDPMMSIYEGDRLVTSNDNWGGAGEVAEAAASVGAFPFPAASKDAATVLLLPASSYTIHVTDATGSAGVALIELYDTTSGSGGGNPRLVNISARGATGTGNGRLLAGFTIRGDLPVTLLLRGVGPGLSSFGVTGFLARPRLALFRDDNLIATNERWGDSKPAEIAAAATAVGAFALGADSLDCAVLVTLTPGSYTAQVSSTDDLAGIALVEVYEVP